MRNLRLICTMILSIMLVTFHENVVVAGLIGLLLFTNGCFVGYYSKNISNHDKNDPNPARETASTAEVVASDEGWALVKNPNGSHTKLILLADK